MGAKSHQSCPILYDPMALPSSSLRGILQARIPEWVVIPPSKGSSQPKDGTRISYISCIGSGFFTSSVTWEAHDHKVAQKSWEKND